MVFMSFGELLQQSCRQRGGGPDPQDQFPTCLPSAGMGHHLPLYSRTAASPGNPQAVSCTFKEDRRLQFPSLAESAIIRSLLERPPGLRAQNRAMAGRHHFHCREVPSTASSRRPGASTAPGAPASSMAHLYLTPSYRVRPGCEASQKSRLNSLTLVQQESKPVTEVSRPQEV